MQRGFRHIFYRAQEISQRVVSFLGNHPRVTLVAIGLCLLSFLIIGMRIVREPPGGVQMFRHSLSDFEDYHEASGRFLHAVPDPYRVDNLKRARDCYYKKVNDCTPLESLEMLQRTGTYLYPPFLAFLLTPLADLTYKNAAIIFNFLSWGMLLLFIWSMLQFMRRTTPARQPLPEAKQYLIILGAVLLIFQLLSDNAARGNIGFILILLCGQGILWSFGAGRWRGLLGGFLLGMAAVIKVTPGLLGFVLVGGRRPLALIGMLGGTLFALFVPGLLYGFDANINYLNDWNRLLIQNFGELTFIRGWVNNQSVVGFIGKLFVPGQTSEQSRFGLPWTLFAGHSTAERLAIFAMLARTLNTILLGLLALSALRQALRKPIQSFFNFNPVEPAQQALQEVGLVPLMVINILVSLLISGVSWYHAYCMLFIPLVLYLWRRQNILAHGKLEKSIGMRFSGGSLLIFGLAYVVFPPVLRDFLSVYSIFALAMYVVCLLLAFALIVGRPDQTAREHY